MCTSSVDGWDKSLAGVERSALAVANLRASVLLLTYNQVRFVGAALQSILDQDLDEIEIIVSDDFSVDGTWERLEEIAKRYGGAKRLRLFRNASNLGIVGNLCQAARRASSDNFFIAHGDDLSLPNRVSRCLQFHRLHGERLHLIAADAFDMDEDGSVGDIKHVDDLGEWTLERWATRRPFVLGAAQMITRRLLESTPLDNRLSCEDQCLSFRAIQRGVGFRIPEPLIRHRRGGLSQQRARDPRAKRQALLRSARATIIELGQLERDALEGGTLALVEPVLQRHRRLNTYIIEMLEGRLGVWQRIWRCALAGLPWSKRLRFLAWSFRGRQKSPEPGQA
jgi:glycosyltransferase involved in cell wall biosynthesis